MSRLRESLRVAAPGPPLAVGVEASHRRLSELILGLRRTLLSPGGVAILPQEEFGWGRKQMVSPRPNLRSPASWSRSPSAFDQQLTDAA